MSNYECPRCHHHFDAPVCPACSASVIFANSQCIGSFGLYPLSDGLKVPGLVVDRSEHEIRVCLFLPGDRGSTMVVSYPLSTIGAEDGIE